MTKPYSRHTHTQQTKQKNLNNKIIRQLKLLDYTASIVYSPI